MNQHCHRVVFNRARGQMMAAPETATGQHKAAAGQRRAERSTQTTRSARRLTAGALAALTLCHGMPAYAQLPISAAPGAPAGQRPIMDAAGNGVPLVHIAPPSAAGVSRNQYDQFNVNRNGLILNNSNGPSQTQLGGWVSGNPQLGYTPARIILNEVVSSNPSQLLGTIEVAGRRAGIVIANVNGITCNGCGFLNTDRVTLTTGQTRFGDGGAITGFDVRQGTLSVGGDGLSAAQVEQLDLLARGLVIEGEIWTRNLNAIAGANQVLYASLQATPQTGNGTAPSFAIDIKDVGGMTANQIYLVSTEAGLGVNSTGRLAALQGNLTLSANGDLTVQKAYAQQDLTASASGNVRFTEIAQGQGNTTLSAGGTLSASGALVAGKSLDMRGANLILQNAQASAGQSLTLDTAGNLDTVNSQLASGGALNAIAGGVVRTTGSIWRSAGGIQVRGAVLDNRHGQMMIGGALDVATAQAIDNRSGALLAQGAVQLGATSLNNAGGTIASTRDNITVRTGSGTFDNTQGQLQASGNVTLTTGTITNRTGIISGESIALTSSGVDNSGGQLLANSALQAATGAFVNDGGIVQAGGTAQLDTQGNTFSNRAGSVTALTRTLALNTRGATLDNTGGKLQSADNMTLDSGALLNHDGLVSGANVTLRSGNVDNTAGSMLASGQLQVTTGAFDNSGGLVQATSGLALDTQGQALINRDSGSSGGIVSGGTLDLHAGALDNTRGYVGSQGNQTLAIANAVSNDAGHITSDANLTLDATTVNNGTGILSAANTLQITSDSLNNSGEISADTTRLHIAGTLDNTVTGLIDGRHTDIRAGTTSNTGRIYGNTLDIAGGTVNNTGTGTIAAREKLQIGAQILNNTDGALIYSLGDIGIAGDIDTSGNLTGRMQALLNASSTIEASGNLSIRSDTIINRNDHLVTSSSTTTTPVSERLIQPNGSTEKYHPAILGWDPYYKDHGRYVLPSGQYPFSRYGASPRQSATYQACENTGDTLNCTTTYRYSATDPIWATFDVAPPNYSDLTAPTMPTGWGDCMLANEGGATRNMMGACGTYWMAYDTYNQTVAQRTQLAAAALDQKINAFNNDVNGRGFEVWNEYEITSRTVTEPTVTESRPARLLAGGDMLLEGNGIKRNDSSEIVAGGTLTVRGGAVQNTGVEGIRSETETGRVRFRRIEHHGGLNESYEEQLGAWSNFTPAPVTSTVTLANYRYEDHAANPTTGRDIQSANGGAPVGGTHPFTPPVISITPGPDGSQILSGGFSLILPGGSLFRINPHPGARYLVETDPRFTQFRNFISSDYFLQSLKRDPERELKRYGDGFYEQQLINDQILALTGRRYLNGYRDTEAEYKALMDAGVLFARQYQLTPGVALSAEQMALLTTDIVWLTARTVTLADGRTAEVLVPQVYLRRTRTDDLRHSGALLAATDVDVHTTGDLVNSGTISGNSVTLRSDRDIVNEGGTLRGQSIYARANNDLKNISGRITGLADAQGKLGDVTLLAGRDLVLDTRTLLSASQNGTRTSIDRIATVEGGSVRLDAGRDLAMHGADVNAQKDLIATATRHVDISTVEAAVSTRVERGGNVNGRSGYIEETASAHRGSVLSAGGNLALVGNNNADNSGGNVRLHGSTVAAGGNALIQGSNVSIEAARDRTMIDVQNVSRDQYTRTMRDVDTASGGTINAGDNLTVRATKDRAGAAGNITVTGSDLSAGKGQASLIADNDVHLDALRLQSSSVDDSYIRNKGMLKKSMHSVDSSSHADEALGSTLSGNTVNVYAGKDIRLTGSAIAGTGDVTLDAAEHIRIEAAENRYRDSYAETRKSSGLGGSSVGIGVSYSKQESRTTFDGDRTTQSQSGSVVGSGAGNLVMTAGKNIHVSGSDLIAGRAADDTTKLNGHIDLQAQNITIDPAQDTAITRETRSFKQSSIGVAVVGTPVDTFRNLRAIGNSSDKGYAKARNFVNELAHSGATLPQVAISYGRSASSSTRDTATSQTSNSSVTAAGDIRMRATGNGQLDANGKPVDGNITLTGATLTAGGLAMLDAERDVTLQAATSGYRETSTSSSKSMRLSTAMPSLGDMGRAMTGGPNSSGVSQSPYNMSRSNADGRIENATQTPSLILADRVVMNSRHGNIRVAGSAIAAERDVSLIAKEGKIDIVSGLDTGSEHRSSSSKTIGDLGSDGNGNGTSSTIGVRKESHHYDRNSATQGDIRSSVISNNGNITLDAKDDLTLRGADIAARRKLTMVGKEVIIDPGVDTHHAAESHKTSQYGITNAMGGMVVDAAKAADKAMEAASRGDSRLATLYGAKAALTGYNASQGTHSPTPNAPVNSGGSLFKFTSSVGGGSQQSQRNQSSTTNTGSTLYAGETLTMVGTGTGALDADGYAADGSIRTRGAQITAKNVQMVAARDIDLGSAQDTTHQTSSSKGSNASVGVGFALGGAQNGFTVELGAGKNQGNANGNSVTHQDTIVTASESFTYNSGRDTNLKGAQVIADTIRGKANRDLNIESRQDTDDYQERNRTSGAQISLCIPPFCYGATVSASVQDSKGNIDSTYASVNRQSGFYAGSGGYDIETVGNTDLKGGVISSTAPETQNRIKTNTLTTSDIENRASYSAETSNVALSASVGGSGPGGIDWGGGTSPIQNATNNATSMAAANLQKPQTGTATGTTKSTISPGTVIITDDAAQQKLTGKTAAETVASLNRDTANANQTVKPIFDKQKIERQQEIDRVMAEVAQQAAPILYQKVGDALQNQPAAVKAAVHGLVGGLMAKAMGGEFASGAAGAAAAALAMEAFGKNIANIDGLNQADKDALTQMMGLVVAKVGGMAAGGSATASNAAAVTGKLATEFNYLKHDEVRSRQKELNACRSGNDPQCEVDILKKYEAISAKNTADIGSSGVMSRAALEGDRIGLEALQRDPGCDAACQVQVKTSLKEIDTALNVIAKAPILKDASEAAWIATELAGLGTWAVGKAITSKVVQEYFATKAGKAISDEAAATIAAQIGRSGQPAPQTGPFLAVNGNANFATEANQAFFWSGLGRGGDKIAAELAATHGGTTLEQITQGRGIILPVWDAANPSSIQAWQNASRAYAEGASGTVRAVVGDSLRPGSIWETIELPTLMSNPNVTQVIRVHPTTGVETVIFRRSGL